MNYDAGSLQSIHAFPFSGCNIDAAKCCNASAKRTIDKLSDLETVADLVSDKYACDLYWSPWLLPNPVRVKAETGGRGRHNHETNRERIKCQNTDTAQESKRHRQKEKTLETLVAISVNEDKASSKAARTTTSRGNGRRRSTQIFAPARQCGKPQLVDTDTHLLGQRKYKQVQLFAKNRKKIEERQERQERRQRKAAEDKRTPIGTRVRFTPSLITQREWARWHECILAVSHDKWLVN